MIEKELFDLDTPDCFCIKDVDSVVEIYPCRIVSIIKNKSFRDGISETTIICKVAYHASEWWRNIEVDPSQLFSTSDEAAMNIAAFIDKQIAVIDAMKAKLEQSKAKDDKDA